MDIVIETADRRSFVLEILLFTTVLEIKELIQKYHGVPVPRQILSFNGSIMEDGRYVEQYDLLQGSRVLLHLDPADPRLKMIKHEPAADLCRSPPARSLITVWVPHHVQTEFIEFPVDTFSDTIAHLKEAIRYHFHNCTGKRFPASRTMSLFLGGVELTNSYLPLMDCGVTDGSKIEVRPLTFNMWEIVTVTVVFPGRSPTRTVLHVEMNVEDNVSELRMELRTMRASGQFQSPPPMTKVFFFVFNQAVMREDQTFRWHGVKSGDLIEIFDLTDRS